MNFQAIPILEEESLSENLQTENMPSLLILLWEEVRTAETVFLLRMERESARRLLIHPSLIIYAPVRVLGNKTIVTNGDQTDTIYELMDKQQTFEQALRTREFEPDAPNYTPRISGIMHIENGKFNYAMSILKSNNGDPSSCNRYTFAYENPKAGEAHFIHTYMGDGNPLPSFEGEPAPVAIEGDIDAFTSFVWENLNEDNKVSLFVRYIDIATGAYESRIVNKNK